MGLELGPGVGLRDGLGLGVGSPHPETGQDGDGAASVGDGAGGTGDGATAGDSSPKVGGANLVLLRSSFIASVASTMNCRQIGPG